FPIFIAFIDGVSILEKMLCVDKITHLQINGTEGTETDTHPNFTCLAFLRQILTYTPGNLAATQSFLRLALQAVKNTDTIEYIGIATLVVDFFINIHALFVVACGLV